MSRDHAVLGDANFICDFSGFKGKMSDSVLTWNGFRVLRRFAGGEIYRHPQEFVRGVPDNQAVPNARPEAPDTFLSSPVLASNL